MLLLNIEYVPGKKIEALGLVIFWENAPARSLGRSGGF